MKHLIHANQLEKDILFEIFEKTDRLKKEKSEGKEKKDFLKGKILATLFYEPSTRTRLSFESAMIKLGGNVISTENAKEFSSAIKGESLEDTIRVVDKYSDIVVLRHFEENSAKKASLVSSVPVINAGDGAGQHPTQALLDVYTIWKEMKRLDDLNIVVAGDLKHGRTARSLCEVMSQFKNISISLVSPKGLEIGEDIKEILKKKDTPFKEYNSLDETLSNCDIVYLTRVQKERFTNGESVKDNFQINETNLKLLKKDSRILHPLPHVEEINLPIHIEEKDQRIAYFRQAENGLWTRMGLIEFLLN